MGLLLHALHQHQPLPVGPYPTAKFPEGIDPQRIAHVDALGAKWIVAFEVDGPHEAEHYQFGTLRALPARALLTKVKLGGKWFDAEEGLPENFFNAIQHELDAMEWNA